MKERPDLRGQERGGSFFNTSRKLYLDKYNSKLLGVCAGFAEFIGVEAIWIRLAMVFLTIFTPIAAITVPGYFIMALCVPNKPPQLYKENYEETFGDSTQTYRRTGKQGEEQ